MHISHNVQCTHNTLATNSSIYPCFYICQVLLKFMVDVINVYIYGICSLAKEATGTIHPLTLTI